MNSKELGFIIKRFIPRKQKISILANSLGKIEVIPSPLSLNDRLYPGMLISTTLHPSTTRIYIAHNIEILTTPLNFTNNSNIYWIHSILELCYYFIPLEKPCPEIFNLVYVALFLLDNQKFNSYLNVSRKLFIIKLLVLLGFYPKKPFLQYLNLFEDLVSTFVDFPIKRIIKSLEIIGKKEIYLINLWIMQCLREHPNFSSFKLSNFLTQNESWELENEKKAKSERQEKEINIHNRNNPI